MNIVGIIWLRPIVEKLIVKHQVDTDEVEEALRNNARIQRIERGNVAGEDVYSAISQTDAGRYLTIFFIYKQTREALIISARDSTQKERRRYGTK